MMLGDPFDFLKNVPKYLSRFDSCSCCTVLYKLSPIRDIFQYIGSGILLFYDYLPDNQVTVMPNKSRGGCAGHTVCSCLSDDSMGKNIIAAAKEIVVKRYRNEEYEKEKKKKESEQERQKTIEKERIENLENIFTDRQDKLENQLDEIYKMIKNLHSQTGGVREVFSVLQDK